MATFNDTEEFGLINNILKPRGYNDSFLRKFIKPDTRVTSGNGVTSLDDPTYLGFSLSFDITSPLFNGGIGTNNQPVSDPSFLNTLGNVQFTPEKTGLTIIEQQDANTPLLNSSQESGSSAISYLEKIGETGRVNYLKAFIQGLREISTTRPYYFQSIEGLSEAWTNHTDFTVDPYKGSGDEGITIGCLEAVDLKLTALFSLYKMAVYDSRYSRQVIPNNLLRFDVTVYVSEIRQFKKVRSFLDALSSSQLTGEKFSNAFGSSEKDAINFVNENTAQIAIKFSECMWVPSECGKVFDTVSNREMSVASTSIKWKYGNVEIASQFPGYSQTIDSGAKAPGSVTEAVGRFAKDIAVNKVKETATSLTQAGQRAAKGLFQNIAFGNVYGLGNSVLNAVRNPQIIQNALLGAAVSDPTQVGGVPTPSINSRLFPTTVQPANSLPTDRIQPPALLPTNNDGSRPRTIPGNDNLFGQGPSGPPPLGSNNVFG